MQKLNRKTNKEKQKTLNNFKSNTMKKLPLLKTTTWLILSITCLLINTINAQNIIPQSSSINVFGTSNVHDLEIKATTITGEINLDAAKKINTLTIKIPVASLKSGNGIMDGKTYDAFDYKQNPTISFQLTDASPVKLTENEAELTLTGNLTIAGETRSISFKALVKINKSGDYQLKGAVPLKMTTFKIKPPTAFFGTMKTGDAVNVKFDITFRG